MNLYFCLTLFILVSHTSKLNYRIIIVNTVQCDTVCRYVLPLHVIVVPEHVDRMPSEDGQLTETCKDNKHLQIESHWTVSTIIIL
jgi:hypothetical protein